MARPKTSPRTTFGAGSFPRQGSEPEGPSTRMQGAREPCRDHGNEAGSTLGSGQALARPSFLFRLGEVERVVVHWLLAVEGDHLADSLVGFQDLHSPLAQLVEPGAFLVSDEVPLEEEAQVFLHLRVG